MKKTKSKARKPQAKTATATVAMAPETVLVLRVCRPDMTSSHDFMYPRSGLVEARPRATVEARPRATMEARPRATAVQSQSRGTTRNARSIEQRSPRSTPTANTSQDAGITSWTDDLR